MKRLKIALILLLAFALVGAGSFGWGYYQSSSVHYAQGYQAGLKAGMAPEIDPAMYYPVVEVTDGDTIAILIGDKRVKVRALGINTPETVSTRTGVQCYGPEASAEAKRLLEGKKVRLEFDKATKDGKDQFRRYLAYIWLQDGTLYQAYVLEKGLGRQYKLGRKYERYAQFCSLQASAKSARKGLWHSDTCAAESAATDDIHECKPQ